MSKEMVIAASSHETKVAILEDGQVVEVSIEREKEFGLVGSIYKGRVTRVLPGMQSAFIDIGLDRDAFLYVSDFFQDLEEYERVLASAEEGMPLVPAGPPAAPGVEAPSNTEVTAPEASAVAPAPRERPEQRRLGRRSHRSRRPHHRGRGRGRGPRRFEPTTRATEAARKPDAYEPLILPGESLAKYKDLVPAPAVEPESPPEPPERPVGAVEHDLGNDTGIENASRENEHRSEEIPALSEPAAPEQDEAPAEPVTEEPEAPVDVAPPSAETEPPAQPEPLTAQAKPVAADDVRVQVTPVAELTPPKPPSDYIAVEEVTGEESQPAGAAEPSEPYVEVPEERRPSELRGEEKNSSVTLPPSVRERTAGGVEWEKPRRARPREHRRRGRRRRRPATTVQPRAKISELLHPGQEVIVQIIKEQIGTKGARITSHVTLPGRYLVYMPTIEHIGVSRRIRTEEERARLRRILLQLKGSLSGGFVLRTAAEGAREDDIRRDLEYLVKLWRDIVQRADQTAAPVLLHRDLTLLERILRDQLTADFETLWIDSEEEYAKVVEFVSRFQPALVHRAKLYTKDEPIFEGMGIQQEIEHALRPKVWLKSGGYIVINHTEALVAIDVNTGKFVGRGSTRLEDTIVTTNLDAVREIVRQIRLRDLGGIIVIDFIDMEDRRNRQKVMQALEQELRRDRAPSKILAFNEFGLVAITRKRVRQSLEKVLCQPCPYCIGTGMVKSIPTLCYEIQAEARKMAQAIDAPELTIRAHPEVAKALKGREAGLVRELEEQTGKNIVVQPDQSLQFDQYNIF